MAKSLGKLFVHFNAQEPSHFIIFVSAGKLDNFHSKEWFRNILNWGIKLSLLLNAFPKINFEYLGGFAVEN